MPKKRNFLRDWKKAWADKRQVERKRAFRKDKIKGFIIYWNTEAIPLKPGQKSLNWQNIERISLRDVIAEGGYGVVNWANMKIKGKRSPQKVVIKQFLDQKRIPSDLPEIIRRLDESSVSHAKMSLFCFDNGQIGIVMEPFLKKGSSKFFERDDLISSLDLRNINDRLLFQNAVKETAELAKNCLYLKQAFGKKFKHPRVDVFSAFSLKRGGKKVIVQDIDTLRLNSNSSKCWSNSLEVLLRTVSFEKGYNESFAKEILARVAKASNLE